MKHKFLFGLTMLTALSVMPLDNSMAYAARSASAQNPSAIEAVGNTGSENGIIGGKDMKEIVSILSDVKAYVFLGKGESRDLTKTFSRSEVIDFKGMETDEDHKSLDYEVGNKSVATIDTETGKITGVGFGETIIRVYNPISGNTQYFVAFVCPTITVKSPEGIVYSYPKMYNHRAKINLTASDQFMINTVLRDGVDITDKVSGKENEDGYYLSNNPITQDVTFVISEESVPGNYDGEAVVGSCGLKVYTEGNNIYFKDTTEDKRFKSILGKTVHIDGPGGVFRHVDVVSAEPEEGLYSAYVYKSGVFLLEIDGLSTKFKIVVE